MSNFRKRELIMMRGMIACQIRGHPFFFIFYYNNKINKKWLKQHNTELSPEERKVREQTGKEVAEDRVGLIIKSLVILFEIISSFFFRKFLLKSWGFYIWIKSTMQRSLECFSISFSSIFKIIFHNFGARIVILYLVFVSLKEGTI